MPASLTGGARTSRTVRRCPICSGSEGQPVWEEDGFVYARCAACSLVFSDLPREQYDAMRHNAWNEPELTTGARRFYRDARIPVYEAFLDRTPPYGRRRLLDVGSGLGFFLAAARTRGWHVSGVDTSEPWVKHAREVLGLDDVHCGPVDSLEAGARFDLITAWDVLEHIYDPLPFLASLRELMHPGGRIFIRTPNWTFVYSTYRVRRALLGHDLRLGPLNHVIYFTAATLRRALVAAGLRADTWRTLPPPQVSLVRASDDEVSTTPAHSLHLKNVFAAAADRVARASRGSLVIGSDLDVFAHASL